MGVLLDLRGANSSTRVSPAESMSVEAIISSISSSRSDSSCVITCTCIKLKTSEHLLAHN